MTKIYILERNGVPFYVGKTLQEIQDRFYTHGSKRKDSEIIEIDRVSDADWRFWESWYIDLFKSWGFKLENKNDGGGGRDELWHSYGACHARRLHAVDEGANDRTLRQAQGMR